MNLPLSIVIPALNEETYLPLLLKSIANQTVSPSEVIVVDNNSTDTTAAVAKDFHAKVVSLKKRSIAAARNHGASFAKTEFILFLDADVVLPPSFLEITMKEMQEKKFAAATCLVTPLSDSKIDRLLHEGTNVYMQAMEKISPRAPGFCIYVKRSLHEKINGFDETITMAEDHDYIQRAKKKGAFGILKSQRVFISVRRLTKEGRVKLAWKYFISEVYTLFVGKIRRDLYSYKFGEHENK